jgi:hypothetical protein
MSLSEQSLLRHANRYSADSACANREGIVSHEAWCSSKNARVRYAFEVALYPDRLTTQDTLILHALGVIWNDSKLQFGT